MGGRLLYCSIIGYSRLHHICRRSSDQYHTVLETHRTTPFLQKYSAGGVASLLLVIKVDMVHEVGGVARRDDDDNNIVRSIHGGQSTSCQNGTLKMPLKFTCAKFRVKFFADVS